MECHGPGVNGKRHKETTAVKTNNKQSPTGRIQLVDRQKKKKTTTQRQRRRLQGIPGTK
jgi:hypothetical protein